MAFSEAGLEGVVAHPLFYDALSGEFTPPSDPETQHTLGRLAFATLAKGEAAEGHGAYAAMSYRPSWAPEVTATVGYNDYPDNEFSVMNEIWLRSETGGQNLYISNCRLRSRRTGLYLATERATREMPLALGSEVAFARNVVSRAAQNFFTAAQNGTPG